MKNKLVSKSDAIFVAESLKNNRVGMICGIIPKSVSINFDRHNEIEIRWTQNYSYKSFENLTSSEECLNECIKEQISCNAATFYNKKSKNCYLFQDIKTERVKNNNSVLFTRKSLTGTLHCIVLSKKSIKLIFFKFKIEFQILK